MEERNFEGYTAALYIRLSKEDENEGPSGSVQNQRALLGEFARRHQIRVFDTYIDDGWSGTNFERPAFQRMIADIEKKKVNLILTKDLSRLGRDYIMTGYYMEKFFPEKKVRYLSLLDGIDTGAETAGNDMTPFKAILNDLYAKDISRKIRCVKYDQQRRGLFTGGKPVYGYRKHPQEKNKLVIDEEAAKTVRRIFTMALEGKSCRGIAQQLNREGVEPPAVYAGLHPGRQGAYFGKWSSERISAMLQNETYLGKMVQGRRRKISYKSGKCAEQPREKWVIVEGTHEPLISPGEFDRIQRMIQSRAHTRSRTYDFLLRGLIFCRECGYPLGVMNRPPVSGEKRLFFVCRTYQRFTKERRCTCHSILERRVCEAVVETIRKIGKEGTDEERLCEIAERFWEEKTEKAERKEEKSKIQRKLEEKRRYLDKTYQDRLQGVLEKEDFLRIYQSLCRQREELEKRMKMLEKTEEEGQKREEKVRGVVRDFWKHAFFSRELLFLLVERIELSERKEITLFFRFSAPEKEKRLALAIGDAASIED